VILILATQRPDKDSLPTGVSANVGMRFCLRVTGQVENDMILGTSMYKTGVRASLFRPSDKGIGMLVGGLDEPTVVRTSYIDIPLSKKIGQRARALRLAAGTLSGYAAGDRTAVKDDGPDYSLLADVLQVMRDDKEHLAVVAARLSEESARYRTADDLPWPTQHLGSALRAAGVTTSDQTWAIGVKGAATNAVGVSREAIREAISRAAAP
jgi:S-DNA-T family DNA segregation ATPase FtsK/SpoIIIE